MSNDIEVYYKNKKFAGVALNLVTPILIFIDCFLIIVTIGSVMITLEDLKSGLPMLIFFLLLSVGFIYLTKFLIPLVYRAKWLLVTVNGSRITMRDKRSNSFCIDVSEIEGIDWKFIKPRASLGWRGLVIWHESLVIKTGAHSFIVPGDYMNGYEKFRAYLQENVAPEKIKKIKIDYNKE